MWPRYRLIQDGMPVAWSEGPRSLEEIKHYALVYSQDGPVMIEQRVGKRWKLLPPPSTKADSDGGGA